jgi:hypothetical protein
MASCKGDLNKTLAALTSSAFLLPAYQSAMADAPPEFTEIGMRYSKYKEDDLSAKKTINGVRSERMDIDVAQFHLLAPVSDDWSVALDVGWEDMSGASPWFVGEIRDGDGDPKVVMSGASIEDTRTEVSVTTRYYFDSGTAGVNYTYSDEDDYESKSVSLDGSLNSEDGLTTYSGSLSASDDDITPTQGTYPTNTLSATKDIRSAWIGVSRIISKRALVRFGLSYTYRDGYLTDPYKYKDNRPDERKEWTASAGYRHFFAEQNAALHVDYRYFDDDWDITVAPFIRYYTQDRAKFFSVVINDDNDSDYFSDDYRLSSFGAFSYGLRVNYEIGNWSVNADAERYQTDESWGLYSGEEAPALVDTWRYGVGLSYAFR